MSKQGLFWRKCGLPSWLGILSVLLLLNSCQSLQYYQGAGKFYTIVLDAGHGGHDLGGRPTYGLYEKDINLDIVRRMAPILCQRGYHVILTRDSDTFITLGSRTATANNIPGAIFVSIHTNWSGNRRASGLETYYYAPNSQRLAGNILRDLKSVYLTPIRGVKFAKYYVLRHNFRPAVLCEVGFDSNRRENSLLQNGQHRQRLAEAIVQGIISEAENRFP